MINLWLIQLIFNTWLFPMYLRVYILIKINILTVWITKYFTLWWLHNYRNFHLERHKYYLNVLNSHKTNLHRGKKEAKYKSSISIYIPIYF